MYSNCVNDWDCTGGNSMPAGSIIGSSSPQGIDSALLPWEQREVEAINAVVTLPSYEPFGTYQRELKVLESMNLLNSKEPELQMSRITRCFKLNKL